MSDDNEKEKKHYRFEIRPYPATISAVSSVDNVASYVVGDQATAMSIRTAVCSLDNHDLTAVRNHAIPPHVDIPDSKKSHDLAASYAEAELSERDKKSGWFKTWGGWIVAAILALIAAVASS